MKLNIVFDSSAISLLLQPDNLSCAPSLSSLLGMAHQTTVHDTVEGLVCRSAGLGKQTDWPIAAISSLAEQWDTPSFKQQQAPHHPVPRHDDGYWLRVDPVHFVLQRDYFTLSAILALPVEESRALLATLNEHFAPDGLTFLASADQMRWYLYLQDDPQITTVQPALVQGQNTAPHMPKGPGAAKWNRLLNEVQMLLFDHPVNQLREQQGELIINSIWLSGGGRRPVLQQTSSASPSLQVLGSSVFVQGLELLKGLQPWTGQGNFPGTDNLQSLLTMEMDEVWLMGETLIRHEAQSHAIKTIEQRWFKPILMALRKARIEQVAFYICWDGNAVNMNIRPADSWKFWRKPKPLIEVLSGVRP